MKVFRAYIFTCIASMLSTGCGESDDSVSINCNTPILTVDCVNNEFATSDIFVLNGVSASDTTLIHIDDMQGNPVDIDRIILSRITHTSGNSLALSYSVYDETPSSNNTFMAFYIDTDNNQSTGEVIGNIGADSLILRQHNPPDNNFQPHDGYHERNATDTNWVAQSILGASGQSGYSINSHVHDPIDIVITVPLYSGLDTLYATNVRGVMKIVTLTNGDPNALLTVIDTTSEFNFMVP
ncbi:MAG: hypothetical protein OEY66_10635 [Gammaproteobacteria bacterium]|nr:hypothetical protein [Gammaproteobacteria bacterium]